MRPVPILLLLLFAWKVHAQCPTNAQWAGGGTFTLPTDDGSCDGAETILCEPPNAVSDITGNFTVLSCVTVNFDRNGRVDLNGTLTINEGATVSTDGVLRVSGTLNVNGTLDVGGNLGLSNGTVNIGTSAIVDVAGSVNFNATNGGTLDVDGTLNVTNNFNLSSNADVSGDGYITYGSFNDSGGTITGSVSDCASDPGAGDCGDATLPVELLSFKGRHDDGWVSLTWSTASEVDNEGFIIEQSLNGVNFEANGFVQGRGNSESREDYSYRLKATHEIGYYRLKQVDFDGQYEYSPIIRIANSPHAALKVEIYPNPTSDFIQLSGPANERYMVMLNGLSGKSILEIENVDLLEARDLINLVLPSLDRGFYLLSFSNGMDLTTTRLVLK